MANGLGRVTLFSAFRFRKDANRFLRPRHDILVDHQSRSTPSMLGQVEHRVEEESFSTGSSGGHARRSCARSPCLATATKASSVKLSFDILQCRTTCAYCFTKRILRLLTGSGRARRSSRSSRVAITGKRPTNSGMRPNFRRSSGSPLAQHLAGAALLGRGDIARQSRSTYPADGPR